MRMLFLKRWLVVVLGLVVLVFFGVRCMDGKENKEDAAAPVYDAAGRLYTGSQSCRSCHNKIYESAVHTAHYRTSRPANDSFVLGDFAAPGNRFAYAPEVVVKMEKHANGFYQAQYDAGEFKKQRRMDIVVGSGAMGQSFLTWRSAQLFQLPITFFSAANTWSNSPGFPPVPVFNRVITSRCLECHSTFFKTTSPAGAEPETFSKSNIIYGVDCERCHGAAADHVQYQQAHPADTLARFIVNPARLSRQQNLDLCALCHGGRLQKTKPSFSFTVGDTLAHFFNVDTATTDPANIDVHGNQYGLLRASKCFLRSTTLTCNTCHNTHERERGATALFSARCTTCHGETHGTICKLQPTMGNVIKANCIDCHMPQQASRAIAVFLPGQTAPTAARIRSHYIAIYPQQTQKILALLKSKK